MLQRLLESKQYTSKDFAVLCGRLHVTHSMGAVGTSADNAMAESFNATLQRELLRGTPAWPDQATCRRDIFRWATRYNTRRHSGIGLYAPASVHDGTWKTIRTSRQDVLDAAWAAHPNGSTARSDRWNLAMAQISAAVEAAHFPPAFAQELITALSERGRGRRVYERIRTLVIDVRVVPDLIPTFDQYLCAYDEPATER